MNKYNQIIEEIIKQLKTENIPFGAMYILPDGNILDLSTFENGHADLWVYLDERIPSISYSQANIANFLRDLGWIKANTKERYIESHHIPTKKQTEKLAEILKTYPITAKIFL